MIHLCLVHSASIPADRSYLSVSSVYREVPNPIRSTLGIPPAEGLEAINLILICVQRKKLNV